MPCRIPNGHFRYPVSCQLPGAHSPRGNWWRSDRHQAPRQGRRPAFSSASGLDRASPGSDFGAQVSCWQSPASRWSTSASSRRLGDRPARHACVALVASGFGPFDIWIRDAAAADVVQVLPLDVDVVIALDGLPSSFHGDPADRLIVSTARAHKTPLATHDGAIRKSRVAPVWKA